MEMKRLTKREVKKERSLLTNIKKHWMLYIMILPGVLFYIVLKYIPLLGTIIAFQDYQIFNGILNSPWVGFDNFIHLFSYQDFYQVLRNTFLIAFLFAYLWISGTNHSRFTF